MADVIKAADFAAKKHRDQRRKGPDKAPYINHPVGVANILANEGKAIFFPNKAPYINHSIGVANILANEGKAIFFPNLF